MKLKNEILRLLYLTPFKFSDFTVTNTDLPNLPNEDEKRNINFLREKVVLPLFLRYGIFKINSCFRSKQVNEKVGGVETSQHRQGLAIDVDFGSYEKNKQIWEDLKDSNIPIDQCIFEYWDNSRAIIHISTKRNISLNREQFLIQKK